MSSVEADARRRLMSRFRGKDTKPEILVRQALHRAGRRFRVNVRNLPGKPDIVMRKDRTIIFVHGCFWHSHQNCSIARVPKTKPEFWKAKFASNLERDERVAQALRTAGWRVIVIWECEARGRELVNLLARHGVIY